ncbi:MAG TPA: FxLYD domain-containing protein [Anaerolineae bacterium]|nr:FxLYD domain-containing protein [Anaerolineae bacterium]
MNTNPRKLIAATAALIVLVVALAGCTMPPLPTPTSIPYPPDVTDVPPTDTPAPTPTPIAPPPTATPEPPTPEPVEMATYRRNEWGLAFQYPAEWQILEESGERTVLVSGAGLSMFMVHFAAQGLDLSPALLRSVLEDISAPGEEVVLGEAAWRSVGGYDAEVTRVTAMVAGTNMSGPMTLVSDPKTGYSFLFLAWTAKSQVDQQQPTFDAIFDSVEFFPPRAALEQPAGPATSIEGQLAILNESYFTSAGGTLRFVGEVQNDADVAAEDAYVRVQLFDGDGAQLTDEEWSIPMNLIPKGDRSPFEVLFIHPPADWSTYKVEARAEQADFMLRYTYSDLEIVEHSSQVPDFGDYKITGLVQNTGDKVARFVQVTATLYDSEGTVVAVDYTFVEADLLEPGDTSAFAVTLVGTSGPADSYRVQVQGTEAD